MANYYCEYCGRSTTNVTSLTIAICPRHPDGMNKGRHKLYEGSEKSSYICKYCGRSARTIAALTAGRCPRHPKGMSKGWHSPAL